jgi:predicted lipoprotein with Yx(FWY)xxD motif
MSSERNSNRRRLSLLSVTLLTAALAALAVAALTASALTKSSNTIGVAKNGKVTNQNMVTKTEAIAVNSKGRAIYDLIPETVHHLLCTKSNGCLMVWPPVTVRNANSKPSAATGIKGKLGILHRNGLFQVTLAGHPLYTFAGDSKKDNGTGEGIVHFGGTWHVIKATVSSNTTQVSSTTPSTPTTTTPTTTTPTTSTPYGY